MLSRHPLLRLALLIALLGGGLASCVSSPQKSAFFDSIPVSSQSGFDADLPQRVVGQHIARLPTPILPTGTNISPNSTTPDTGLDAACLEADWEMADLRQAVSDSYANAQSSLALEAITGNTLYRFADGELTIQFNTVVAEFSGEVDGLPILARQTLEGSATARYQIDEFQNELVLTDFGGEGITAGLDVNNQRLAEGSYPVWRAFTSGLSNGADAQPTPLVAYSRVAAQCSPFRLILQSIEPTPGPVIYLYRSE